MAFFRRKEKRIMSLADLDKLMDMQFAKPAVSGVSVNETSALAFSAVYACVSLISSNIASLPLFLYNRDAFGGRARAVDNDLYYLLHDAPNPEQTAFMFWETFMGHLLGWGNAYAEIERSPVGIKALWPQNPSRITVKRDNTLGLYYERKNQDNTVDKLSPLQMYHVPGLSFNGLIGYKPMDFMREQIGLGLAAEEYGSRYYENDARPSIVLKHPEHLSQDAIDRILEDWTKIYGGLHKSHKPAVLEEGLDIQTIGIAPENSQFIETRRFQIEEVARMFGVPLAMIQHESRDTSWGTGISVLNTAFAVYTIRPWLAKLEQGLNIKLLTEVERKTFYFEFLMDGLIRGDMKSRYEAYAIGRQNGWLNADEIRALENINPMPEGQGATYYYPSNWLPVGETAPAPTGPPAAPIVSADSIKVLEARSTVKQLAQSKVRIQRSFHPLFKDAAARVVKREVQDLMEAAPKQMKLGAEHWRTFYEDYYKNFDPVFIKVMKPVFHSYAERIQEAAAKEVDFTIGMRPGLVQCLDEHIDHTARFHSSRAVMKLRMVMQKQLGRAAIDEPIDPELQDVLDELGTWEETIPDTVATWEATRTNGLVSKATYFVANSEMEWVAEDNASPMCNELDGFTMDFNEFSSCGGGSFYDSYFEGRAMQDHFRPTWGVTTPPLYEGCGCQIIGRKRG